VPTIRIAFFRNLNHGHRGSPTGAQLVDAFGGSGAARAFQGNGTVIFASTSPEATLRQAVAALGELGFHHEYVVRTLPEIVAATELIDETTVPDDVYRMMVSFFDVPALPPAELPLFNGNRMLEVRRLEPGVAASLSWRKGSSVGDPTAFLEPYLGVPVTSRTLGTIQRLAKAAQKAFG